jgi:hypothetical protein
MSAASPAAGRTPDAPQRGSALIVALVLLIVVTTLGLVALRGARGELSTAGSARLARTTYFIAEGGLMAAIQRIGGAFQEYLTIATIYNNGVIYLDEATLPDSLYGETTDPGGGSLGKLAATPGVVVTAFNPVDQNLAMAGFSKNFHFKKMTFEAVGRIDLNVPVSGSGTLIRMRAHATLGPVQD